MSDYLQFMYNLSKGLTNPFGNLLNDGQKSAVYNAMGQLPFVGDTLRAVNSYKRTMDIYNATGKVSAYPGSGADSGGYSGLINQGLGALKNAKTGTHSLHDFYTNW